MKIDCSNVFDDAFTDGCQQVEKSSSYEFVPSYQRREDEQDEDGEDEHEDEGGLVTSSGSEQATTGFLLTFAALFVAALAL